MRVVFDQVIFLKRCLLLAQWREYVDALEGPKAVRLVLAYCYDRFISDQNRVEGAAHEMDKIMPVDVSPTESQRLKPKVRVIQCVSIRSWSSFEDRVSRRLTSRAFHILILIIATSHPIAATESCLPYPVLQS
jgi:hypothetical protein